MHKEYGAVRYPLQGGGMKVTPNRALEPTRNGRSLQALISFWAFRSQPPLAAQLQR